MLSLNRALDRELGPVPAADGPPSDSMLRDWPLLLGLLAAALLIVASTLVGSGENRPDGQGVASGTVKPAGFVSSVEAKPLETKQTPAASTPGRNRSRKGKHPAASAGTSDSSAAATPSGTTKAPGDTATGGSSSSTPAAPSKSPSGSPIPSGSTAPGAQTGKLVNVTSLGGSFTAGGVFYTVKAPTHTPTVGTPWALSIAATRGGKPLEGVIRMDILHQGSVVAHVVTAKLTGGRYRRSFAWPDQSVGYPLTIKASVTGGGISQSFLYDVKVRKAGG